MIAFWIAAALLSSASAGLVMHRAARAAGRAARHEDDPTLSVYRRQLAEVDELSERGLLTDEEFRSTRTEAARRLLSAADAEPKPATTFNAGRAIVVAVAALAPLVALGLYLFIGSPGTPDQPFKARLAGWRRTDPANLDAERMVAVLQQVVAEKPGDPEALAFLARAQAGAGDSFSGERSLQKALKLAPKRADLWTLYGQMLAADQASDRLSDDARAALQTALALDPKAAAPRYFLARDQIAAGDVDGGLAGWRALRQDLPAADDRGQGLDQEIALVARTRGLPPSERTSGPERQASEGGDQKAFIRSMVARLAARLQASPNDPPGWARLVRSYVVLGDATDRDLALTRARVLFKDRPGDLATIEAAAK